MTLIQDLAAKAVADTSFQSTRSRRPITEIPLAFCQALAGGCYENIETHLDAASETFWCHMRPRGKPIVTHGLLSDLADMQASLRSLRRSDGTARGVPFSYFVFASRTPGIFSLGGDLDHFAECVRAGDRAAGSVAAGSGASDGFSRTWTAIAPMKKTAAIAPGITAAWNISMMLASVMIA